jgi:hypothetical protein
MTRVRAGGCLLNDLGLSVDAKEAEKGDLHLLQAACWERKMMKAMWWDQLRRRYLRGKVTNGRRIRSLRESRMSS